MLNSHEQVTITNHISGVNFKCDEGVSKIIKILMYMGVKTQFSCQGGFQPAYVIADYKSFRKVIKKLKEHKNTYVISRMFAEPPQLTLWTRGRWFCKNTNQDQNCLLEYYYTWEFGLRTTIRWPEEETESLFNVLNAIYKEMLKEK